jgi:CheY-like chemotaxis protein
LQRSCRERRHATTGQATIRDRHAERSTTSAGAISHGRRSARSRPKANHDDETRRRSLVRALQKCRAMTSTTASPEPLPLILGHPMPDLRALRTATILIIDDDDDLRRLYRKKLVAAGYQVMEAADGRSGFLAARAGNVNAVLLDVMMPEVDGWGVLAALRDDAHLADLKIVMMSACSGRLAELQESDVVADGWFLKGCGGSIVDAVDGVLARRFGVLCALGDGAWGPLSDVGVHSLLGGLCEARLCCVLTIDDGVTTWRIQFDDGVIAQASATCAAVVDDLAIHDRQALLRLLEVADAPWSLDVVEELPARTLGLPWRALVDDLCEELNEQRDRVRHGLLSMARSASLDASRLITWSRQASAEALEIVRAVVDGKPPRELVAEGAVSPVVVDAVLTDLVRRGVIAL